MPSTAMTGFGGQSIPEDANFFAAPPPQIGAVLAAETTMRLSSEPASIPKRIGIAAITGTVGAGLMYSLGFLNSHLSAPESGFAMRLMIFGFVVLGGFAFLATGADTCTYLGEHGIVDFRFSPDPAKRSSPKFFLFSDAAELRTEFVDKFVNGAYTGTTYNFWWRDAHKRMLYSVSGRYLLSDENGTPSPKSTFHLGKWAEDLWSQRLLPTKLEEMNATGAVQFGLYGEDFVSVGRDYLEVRQKGQTHRVPLADIGDFDVRRGIVKLITADAREGILGVGSHGVFSFEYGKLANAKLFFLLVQDLLARSASLA
jgi:hypothetical protein